VMSISIKNKRKLTDLLIIKKFRFFNALYISHFAEVCYYIGDLLKHTASHNDPTKSYNDPQRATHYIYMLCLILARCGLFCLILAHCDSLCIILANFGSLCVLVCFSVSPYVVHRLVYSFTRTLPPPTAVLDVTDVYILVV